MNKTISVEELVASWTNQRLIQALQDRAGSLYLAKRDGNMELTEVLQHDVNLIRAEIVKRLKYGASRRKGVSDKAARKQA
jgi:hypothetical protein